jgi:hypothetical protein
VLDDEAVRILNSSAPIRLPFPFPAWMPH